MYPTLFAFCPLCVYNIEKSSIRLTGKLIVTGHITLLIAALLIVLYPLIEYCYKYKRYHRDLSGRIRLILNLMTDTSEHSPEEEKKS